MTLTAITRKQAAALAGANLPYGLRWYLARGLQWYPTYGDVVYTQAATNGLQAIIGKRKQVSEVAVA